jgi:hypothetical protein
MANSSPATPELKQFKDFSGLVALLLEYRQALISAAFTGQIDIGSAEAA